jgi:hypothetical protein
MKHVWIFVLLAQMGKLAIRETDARKADPQTLKIVFRILRQ